MIPVHLKIKGLYSYQKEQEIDFEPLTGASLFGIFGAVGSGKSSVLEAITFALYGDTERLNKSGDERTYNMMNLRSDDLLIDFECIAGKKGDHYRFTVRGKRNGKNFKDVKTFERRAYIKTDGEWQSVPESESIEHIIGLSYDNFRRSIIIPQGRFQEFIELKDAERTKMMKELFQLEKYDLSNKVTSLNSQNNIEISHVEGQLLAVGEVNPDMIAETERTRSELGQSIIVTEEDLQKQTKLEAEFARLKQITERITGLKTQLAELESRKPEIAARTEALRIFEICTLHFKALFEQKDRLQKSLKSGKEEFEKNEIRRKELEELLVISNGERNLLRPSYESRENLTKKAEELEKLILIFDNQNAIGKTKASLNRGEELLKGKNDELLALKAQKNTSEQELEVQKSTQPDFNEIAQVKSWFVKAQLLRLNKENIVREGQKLSAGKTEREQKLALAIKDITLRFELEMASDITHAAYSEILTERFKLFEEQRKALDAEMLDLNTRLNLRQYAVELKDGDPCPLCGAVHHPGLLSHSDESHAANDLNLRKTKLISEEKTLREESPKIDRIFQEIAMVDQQRQELLEKYKLAAEEEKEHAGSFVSERFSKDKKEEFDKFEADMIQLQTKLKTDEAQLKSLGQQVEKLEEEIREKFEKPLQLLRDDILTKEQINNTLSSQFLIIHISEYADTDEAVIRSEAKGLRQQFDDIKKAFELLESKIDMLEKENNTLVGGQAILKLSNENQQTELTGIDRQIQNQLSADGFSSEAEVKEVLLKSLNVSEERKHINDYELNLNNVQRDLAHLQAEGNVEGYDAQEHEKVLRQKELLTAKLNEDRKEEGRLDGLLKQLREDLQRRTALIQTQDKLNLRRQHLAELAKLFRSSGFVDYASSIYLNNLIQSANVRFHQMTHQQLHLELGENNSFWVRDLLNGGHMRLLKTLSGGQKFQAALSLALALADHIHIRNESKHNFFFLDEGFGSLDKNALQTVFETLKSLRKENRIVGIISHVEELQQEIQTYLTIVNGEDGSRILESWK